MPNSFLSKNITVNDKSTAGRFDPKVFVNCVRNSSMQCFYVVNVNSIMFAGPPMLGPVCQDAERSSEGHFSVAQYGVRCESCCVDSCGSTCEIDV